MSSIEQKKQDIWSKIEKEKRIDSIVRRISYIAWGVTFLVFITYAIIVVFEFYGLPQSTVSYDFAGNIRPELYGFILEMAGLTLAFGSVGSLSLGIAIISTIGIFVRMRTSSLKEMRIRLERLEEMIVSSKDVE